MKLTSFLVLAFVISVSASSLYSQTTKLNIRVQKGTFVDVLKQIEKQSEFYFYYNNDDINRYQDVSIDVKNLNIEEVLGKLLKGTDLDYQIIDRYIAIKKNDGLSLDRIEMQQQKSVSGKVTDNTGEGLPGVSVVVKGTTTGTITDSNGKFSLSNVPENATLQFSFVGMKIQEIAVAGKNAIYVTLVEDAFGIDEVVVIGYGTMKKSDLTGSVVSVNSKSLKNTVSNTFDQALQGKAAGVQIMSNSGQPGAATTVRIRGTNSLLGDNEPLYVIDGIQFGGSDEQVLFVGNGGNRDAYRTSPLTSLNPSDIESIEVLKDASACAIYGNRGANGVIIVTTKKGKKNSAHINYEYNYGIKSLAKKMDVLNLQDYARFNNEQAVALGKTPRPEFANPNALTGGTDWQGALFENGQVQNHNLSFSGGTDKVTYYISAGYNTDNGPVVNSWMERYTLRANTEVKMKSWLNFGNNFNFGRTNTKYVMADSGDGPLLLSVSKAPDIPVYDTEGNYVGVNPGQEVSEGGLAQANPIAMTVDRDSRKKKFNIYDNLYFDLLYKDFSFKTEMNFTGDFTDDYAFYAKTVYAGFINSQSNLSEQMSNSLGYEFKNILNYNKILGDHTIQAMIAHEARGGKYSNVGGAGGAFYNNNMNSLSLSNSKYINTSGNSGKWASESYLTRAFYNYKDLAMVTATIRADGSPNFPVENRWGYFPSVSGAFRISNFDFFKKNVDFISNLKINGGYGEVGNDNVLGGLYLPYVGVTPTTDGAFSTTFLNYDPNLRWETTKSANLGLEMAFLKNRINLQMEFYNKKTTDALNQVLLPSSVGSGIYMVSNIASIGNKGVELTLNTVNIEGAFNWKSNFTITINRNKILDLGKGGLPLYGNISKNVTGGPIGRFWGYQIDGLYQNFDDIATNARWDGIETIDPTVGLWMGDAKFVDINKKTGRGDWEIPGHTGQYDSEGKYIKGSAVYTGNEGDILVIKDASTINTDDQTFIGDPNPKFTFGFNNEFTYKNFDLAINIIGVYGNQIYNYTKWELLNSYNYNKNMLNIIKDRAKPELNTGEDPNNIFNHTLANPNSDITRIRQGVSFASESVNSSFIEDGSYLRIQNVVLGYNIPSNVLQKFNISNLRLYVNAQNLYTFTKYSGWDPEIGSIAQSSLNTGIDEAHYPIPRIIMFGVQVGF